MPPPPSAAAPFRNSVSPSPLIRRSCSVSRFYRCTALTASVGFKDRRFRKAWFCTSSSGGGGVSDGDVCLKSGEDVVEKMEAKSAAVVKVQNRRQRIGGNQGMVGLASSPDLLTVPGIGPRNLRKLVENGIEGVAELKQLYKDKV